MGRVTEFEDVLIIQNKYISDNRGKTSKFFLKGISPYSVTENMIIKNKKGVIRGIHFQTKNAQKKIMSCIQGEIWVVVVDLRKDSMLFGDWMGIDFSSDSLDTIIIPKGYGLGTYSYTDAIIDFKCEGEYIPGYDSGIIWNDNDLGIQWPINENNSPMISDKDKGLMSFNQYRELL